jgi:hypothetical protein
MVRNRGVENFATCQIFSEKIVSAPLSPDGIVIFLYSKPLSLGFLALEL